MSQIRRDTGEPVEDGTREPNRDRGGCGIERYTLRSSALRPQPKAHYNVPRTTVTVPAAVPNIKTEVKTSSEMEMRTESDDIAIVNAVSSVRQPE